MIKFLVILFVFISASSFAQKNPNKEQTIFLIGEAHFVKEKYDEIENLTFEKLNDLNKGDKISFFFELPYTLNYAFKKLSEHKDTTVFYEWFNHLFQTKNQSPSYFWTDYKDMVLELIAYADQ